MTLSEMDAQVTKLIEHVKRYPTERNECYAYGYISALTDMGEVPHDTFASWRKALRQAVPEH
jgi:hypothetical protein